MGESWDTPGTVMGDSWATPGSTSSLRRTSKYKPRLLLTGRRQLFGVWATMESRQATVARQPHSLDIDLEKLLWFARRIRVGRGRSRHGTPRTDNICRRLQNAKWPVENKTARRNLNGQSHWRIDRHSRCACCRGAAANGCRHAVHAGSILRGTDDIRILIGGAEPIWPRPVVGCSRNCRSSEI